MGLYEFTEDDARRFAREQLVQTRKRNDELQFKTCPYCHGGSHHDEWTFAINLKTGQNNCKRSSCGASGNMITLSRDFDFSLGNNVDEYYRPSKKFRTIHRKEKPQTRPGAIEYMASRGIGEKICAEYNITTQADSPNILVFPFYDNNDILTFVKYRKTDFDKSKGDKNKEWCEANCRPILFGMNHINPENKTLVMTEGQIDSLSCAEAGIENAVSVPTGAKGFTWIPYCWDFLAQFQTLIVFGDHEHDQITLLDEMAKRFHGTVKHVQPKDYLGCKDANELLTKHGKEAVRAAVENAIPVANPYIRKLSNVQRVDLSQLEKISTGFATLDKMLGGFYFGQLIILTGQRGEGKSTLASEFGTRAIDAGYPVMFYSGELEDWYFRDWIDRQVAGSKYIVSSTSAFGTTNYSIKDRHIQLISDWYDEMAYIYNRNAIQEGETEGDTIVRTMESAIKQYGCRMLVIDNLMTAMSDDLNSDLYRQQSNFVKTLARMAKDFNVLVLLIVHPRKTSQSIMNDDVAGSANITNLADVVMSYSRPDNEEEAEETRLIRVLKNRLNGKLTKDGIPVLYQEASKRIAEVGQGFDWALGWEKMIPQMFHPVAEAEQMEIPF